MAKDGVGTDLSDIFFVVSCVIFAARNKTRFVPRHLVQVWLQSREQEYDLLMTPIFIE